MAGKLHHHVYVVELDPAVLKDKKFVAANPNYHPDLACLYVGMTGLTPELRFQNHKAGRKANKYVQKHGLHLLPSIYEVYNPMTYENAQSKEAQLAQALRKEGHAVWQH